MAIKLVSVEQCFKACARCKAQVLVGNVWFKDGTICSTCLATSERERKAWKRAKEQELDREAKELWEASGKHQWLTEKKAVQTEMYGPGGRSTASDQSGKRTLVSVSSQPSPSTNLWKTTNYQTKETEEMADKYPNSGALFKNDRKQSDKHPDYQGNASIELDGQTFEYRISAWIKEGKRGKFMSLSFKPKDEVGPQRRSDIADEDEIPF